MCTISGEEDTINSSEDKIQRSNHSNSQGKLYVVGIGPGNPLDRTHRAEQAISASSIVVGYKKYLDLIKDLVSSKQLISSGMTKETERCKAAVDAAAAGATVSLVSSGDPGIYGMAGLALEMAQRDCPGLPIQIVPGISAASAAASRLGAPLMLDWACISLSDLLVPWDTIKTRLDAVASVDLVVALYNPKSRKRVTQIQEAGEIFLKYRPATVPVGICSEIGSNDETVVISDLGSFLQCEINMRSVVIIGNSTSKISGHWLITPRGYSV